MLVWASLLRYVKNKKEEKIKFATEPKKGANEDHNTHSTILRQT